MNVGFMSPQSEGNCLKNHSEMSPRNMRRLHQRLPVEDRGSELQKLSAPSILEVSCEHIQSLVI